MLSDLMWQAGRSLLNEPYVARGKKLEALKLKGASWQTPPCEKGGGPAMLDASRKAGLEGIMGKKLDSHYEPGRRSGVWVKVKNRNRQEVVIGGWLDREGQPNRHPGGPPAGYY